MSNLLVLFNHELTEEQKSDAKENMRLESFVFPPSDVRSLWKNIPPQLENLNSYLGPVKNWIAEFSVAGDFLLVEGDYGATYTIVEYAKSLALLPIYATTLRDVKESTLDDGTIAIQRQFKHVRFRRY